jgi:hypothetical protein
MGDGRSRGHREIEGEEIQVEETRGERERE